MTNLNVQSHTPQGLTESQMRPKERWTERRCRCCGEWFDRGDGDGNLCAECEQTVNHSPAETP